MGAPGVGFVTALTFKAGVDDPTRFKGSRTVAAHFGLTPRRSRNVRQHVVAQDILTQPPKTHGEPRRWHHRSARGISWIY